MWWPSATAAETFQLAPGAGDAALTNPRAGKPQKIELLLPAARFHKGVNEIRLTTVEGSWLLYDAITLLGDAEASCRRRRCGASRPGPPRFLRREGKLRRAVDVSVTLDGTGDGSRCARRRAGESMEVSRPEQMCAFTSAT